MMLNNEFLIFRKHKVNSPSAMQRFIFDLSEIFWKIVQIYKIDDSSCAMKPAYTQNPVSIFQNECTSHSYETILSSPTGFTTKAFLSKATFKSLNFLGSCGGWAFGIERFLKVLRLSALTRLIRNLLLRLSEISLAEIGLRQIWMRWLGGRSSSMSEIQKREKARRWILKDRSRTKMV